MSVWSQLGDPEAHARLLAHPYHPSVARTILELTSVVRAAATREEMRKPQEMLLPRLLEAERRYSAESRLTKLGKGDPIDLLFWRRACVQHRAIGDAIAWKFLAYDRPRIVLLGNNQRPGLLLGKAGSDAEWQAWNEHWDAGRPTVLSGLTNCITVADLLIADGEVLRINEVKAGRLRLTKAQRSRMRLLDQELRSSTVRTPGGMSHIVESDVPLASYWSTAEPAITRAVNSGVSTWVPTKGVALLFTCAVGDVKFSSQEALEARFKAVQEDAGRQMGPVTHRILVDSSSYPYRPNRAVPIPLLPVTDSQAAMLLSGEIQFKVELAVDRLVDELAKRGLSVQVALDEADTALRSRTPVLRWSQGSTRGVIHGGVIEQIGVELNDVERWAEAFTTARVPVSRGRVGMYLCLGREGDVWA